MNQKKRAYILLMVLMTVSNAFSQESVKNRNTFFVQTSFYSFFDDNPIIQTKHTDREHWLSNGYGIGYLRKINEKNYWSATLDYYGFESYTPFSEMKKGSYWRRNFLNIQGAYSLRLWEQHKQQLLGSLGLSMRAGNESLFVSYTAVNDHFGEISTIDKILADVGISLGFRYQWFIIKNLNIFSHLDYTFYPYTFDKKNPANSWDTGPTWNMLSLSLGIGFNCGE